MMKNRILTTVLGGLFLSQLTIAPAAAHSAPAILQMGGGARVSHGEGAACQERAGIHLCGATIKAAEETPSPAPRLVERIIIERETQVIIRDRPWRRLRTQGFYSGNIYPSRRFTRGFYADRIARGY